MATVELRQELAQSQTLTCRALRLHVARRVLVSILMMRVSRGTLDE